MAQQARQPAQQKTAQTMRKPTQSRIHQTVSSIFSRCSLMCFDVYSHSHSFYIFFRLSLGLRGCFLT